MSIEKYNQPIKVSKRVFTRVEFEFMGKDVCVDLEGDLDDIDLNMIKKDFAENTARVFFSGDMVTFEDDWEAGYVLLRISPPFSAPLLKAKPLFSFTSDRALIRQLLDVLFDGYRINAVETLDRNKHYYLIKDCKGTEQDGRTNEE